MSISNKKTRYDVLVLSKRTKQGNSHQKLEKTGEAVINKESDLSSDNNEQKFARRKTFNFENGGYRGNFEVPPKDSKACFYSTAGGFFYPKRKETSVDVHDKYEAPKSRAQKPTFVR